jgi:hypothetical protein
MLQLKGTQALEAKGQEDTAFCSRFSCLVAVLAWCPCGWWGHTGPRQPLLLATVTVLCAIANGTVSPAVTSDLLAFSSETYFTNNIGLYLLLKKFPVL